MMFWEEPKRILTIQDISCAGRCSMTVAMPVLSACGFETCILPTAILSTHTGGFGKPVVIHLEDQLDGIIDHWKEQGVYFDCILVGYLGSVGAVKAARRCMEELKKPAGTAIVDPAMGDNGKLYSGITDEYARAMAELCREADVVLPNLTEAACITGLPYRENPDEAYVSRLLDLLGTDCPMITGVSYEPGKTGVVFRRGFHQVSYFHDKITGHHHGTGDLFAAALTAAYMELDYMDACVPIAADFICKCIENTPSDADQRFGVCFEAVLPELAKRIKEK